MGTDPDKSSAIDPSPPREACCPKKGSVSRGRVSLSLVWIGPEARILSVFAAAWDGSNVLAGKPVNLAGVVSPQRG